MKMMCGTRNPSGTGSLKRMISDSSSGILIVPSPDGPDHVFIEANERPGLANHEPQPTAERFIDLLFPRTSAPHRLWTPPGVGGAAA